MKAPAITSTIARAAIVLVLGKSNPMPPIISTAATTYRANGAYPQCENLAAHWMADGPSSLDHPTRTNRHARKIALTQSAADQKFFIAYLPRRPPRPHCDWFVCVKILRLTGCVNSKDLNHCSPDLSQVEFDTRLECRLRMLVFFADFKFDRRTKVLSRDGQPLMLTAQSLELLDILLETPGELISRDMIRQRLWPDSNVEFEHSLDVLVSRLRTTLGDRSKNPRFIQTIPRKGYRFIGQVSSELNLRGTGTVRLIRKLAIYAAIAVVAVVTGVVIAHTRYPTPRVAPTTTLSSP